jgi:hypothetical protein
MWVLTFDPTTFNPGFMEPFTYARGVISTFFDRVRREVAGAGGLRYFVYLQRQPGTGLPHAHILPDRPLPVRDLGRIWAQVSGARVESAHAKAWPSWSEAVSYASRELLASYPRRAWRLWASRGLDTGLTGKGRKEKSDWQRIKKDFATVVPEEEEFWQGSSKPKVTA